MGELRVADVINIEKDIKPYKVVQITSGVGSGKNYWVKNYLAKKAKVLEITSRRKTANSQILDMKAAGKLELDRIMDVIGKNKDVVLTNSQIEYFVKYAFSNRTDKKEYHLWDIFDYIVLDEAHSLTADATFADAPFYVMEFIRRCLDPKAKCKVVLMTGTRGPIEWISNEREFKAIRKNGKYNDLNIYNKCKRVSAKEVVLYRRCNAAGALLTLLTVENYKAIYFSNSLRQIISLCNYLLDRGISANEIAIDYSSNEHNDKAVEELPLEILENRAKTVESLLPIFDEKGERSGGEVIPDNIKVFLTTSTNKEGINIMNNDIDCVFVESCDQSELVQMIGRVRSSVKRAYVLWDYEPHFKPWLADYKLLRDPACLKAINKTAVKYQDEKFKGYMPWDKVLDLIKDTEQCFDNLRFDYFTHYFKVYTGRIEGVKQYSKNLDRLNNIVEHWSSRPIKSSGKVLFHDEWFADSEVFCMPFKSTDEDIYKLLRFNVETLIEPLVGQKIYDKELEIIKGHFVNIFKTLTKNQLEAAKISSFPFEPNNRYYHKYGYNLTRSKHTDSTGQYYSTFKVYK